MLKANRSNDIVQFVRDAAGFLAGPFDNLFRMNSERAETAATGGSRP